MSDNNPSHFLSKKAYEIAYALFRIASSVKRPSFVDHLENKGLALLSATVAEDYVGALIVSRGVEYLLQFGADVGVMNPANAQTIIGELKAFNAAIAELEKSVKPATAVDLDSVFSKLPVSAVVESHSNKIVSREPEKVAVLVNRDENGGIGHINNTSESTGTNGSVYGNGNHSVIKSAMRQSAILERIRQNGNCRLKDIEDLFPETSERTIRYDLQNLVEQGLIERLGNGGPATFYKIR